jgi:hypothetical protein
VKKKVKIKINRKERKKVKFNRGSWKERKKKDFLLVTDSFLDSDGERIREKKSQTKTYRRRLVLPILTFSPFLPNPPTHK